jgi:hypothetical protein
MEKTARGTIYVFLTLLLLFGTMVLTACQEDIPGMSREEASSLTMTDFYGDWDTTLPNGEKWQLRLHEDGRFESLPIRSHRSGISGRWEVADSGIVWHYPGGPQTRGVTKEINPIILKTENKFMLSEKMGMTSVYTRSPR